MFLHIYEDHADKELKRLREENEIFKNRIFELEWKVKYMERITKDFGVDAVPIISEVKIEVDDIVSNKCILYSSDSLMRIIRLTKVTIKELAVLLNTNPTQISKVMHGERKTVKSNVLLKVSPPPRHGDFRFVPGKEGPDIYKKAN